MRNQPAFFILFRLLFLSAIFHFFVLESVRGQELNINGPSATKEYTVSVDSLPDLIPLTGIDSPPSYFFFYIFGDGNFKISDDSIIQHTYPAGFSGTHTGTEAADGSANLSVYTYKKYTGGDEPDEEGLQVLNTDDIFFIHSQTPVLDEKILTVDPGAGSVEELIENFNLDIRFSTTGFRPMDTIVMVNSFKFSPIAIDVNFDTLFGRLYLFYNSRIEVSDTSNNGTPESSTLPEFGAFRHTKDHMHFGISRTEMSLTPSALNTDLFKNVLVYDLGAINDFSEKRVFTAFSVDSIMWQFIEADQIGTNTFLSVLVAHYKEGTEIGKPPQDPEVDPVRIFSKLQLVSTIENARPGDRDALIEEYSLNNFFEEVYDGNTTIVDALAYESSYIKDHDPNNLTALACECPTSKSDPHKVWFRVSFTNDGLNHTIGAFVRMKLPDEFDSNSLEVLAHPQMVENKLFIDTIIGDTLYFDLLGLALHSSVKYGYNDSTRAVIDFTLNTKPNVKIENIDPMKACIFFAGNTSSECTQEKKVKMTISPENDMGEVLSCVACPPDNCWDFICKILIAICSILILCILWVLGKKKKDQKEDNQ